MSSYLHQSDLLIVGAGPAGLHAALAAAESGLQIDIIDDNFNAGGQIWRGGAFQHSDPRARACWQQLHQHAHVRFHFQSKLIHAQAHESGFEVLIESLAQTDHSKRLRAKKIILCTGARERLLPFPGWTQVGVSGAGGLQALSKYGYPVQGKRVVVAGTGPLLLAVAASLRERGAIVSHIIEQSRFDQLTAFAFSLLATPSKIRQALTLAWQLRTCRYWSNSFVRASQSTPTGLRLSVQCGAKQEELECDLLACGYGLVPNVELAAHLHCRTVYEDGEQKVQVDEWQQTSITGIYCAGESCGVGGVDLAIQEGFIAGYAASEQTERARELFGARQTWHRFAHHLRRYFALRPELKQLAQDDTLICRCEDVSLGQLKVHTDWRGAKLHTRCGMGACQGRICGAASQFLFSWEKDLGRTPVSAGQISSLLNLREAETVQEEAR